MGGDSCSKGCEFESRHHILDGHFFTYIFVVKFVFEKTKINEKEAGVGPFKKDFCPSANKNQISLISNIGSLLI